MTQSYESLLATSKRVNWRVEDIIGGDRRLDFSKPFLPESFARTQALTFLSPAERLVLNHVRAHGYLAMFELVEEFILPFVQAQAQSGAPGDAFRAPALVQFASEEAKHMELFRRFKREFQDAFGVTCGFIGPADAIGRAVLDHDELGVAIAILGIEWMSQRHYVECVKGDQALDPQFKSLLRHHWIEEAQHAKLDAMLVREHAARRTPEEMMRAVDAYFSIGAMLDGGLEAQAKLDLAAFELAAGRKLTPDEAASYLAVQHQALRWTFLGSAMSNPNFLAALAPLGEGARARIADAAPAFC